VLPTQVLQAGDTLSAGGRTWQVLELPSAHTESDLALWSAAEGVLIAGGLLDGHGLVLAQGSVVGWLDALDRLQALQPQWLIGQYLVRDAAQVPTAFAAQREALCRLVRWSWQGLDAGWSEAEALNRLPVQGTPNAQRQQRFNLLRAWREMEALWLTQAPMPAACQPP
jgi:glyoxylase-like metal-dependent hydrolase (beta-lactamase superfamily II)